MQNVLDHSEQHNSWRREFPRLAELHDDAPSTEPAAFFRCIPNEIPKSSLAREAFQELESDLSALDEDAWPQFKLLRCDLRSNGRRGYIGIHSVLCEAKGYRYLRLALGERRAYYDEIKLIPENDGQKTPDWIAVLRGVPVAILEVKTVYESDVQLKYLYENTRSILKGCRANTRRGDPGIPGALSRKLKSTVENARRQLCGYAPERDVPRIALIIIHFDHVLTLDPANYAKIASSLKDQGWIRLAQPVLPGLDLRQQAAPIVIGAAEFHPCHLDPLASVSLTGRPEPGP